MLSSRSARNAALLALFTFPVGAQNFVALTADNRLVPLRIASPLAIGPATLVTGLQPGENLVGIDYRPATGRLYGLGNQNRIYVIDPATGIATQAGAALTTPLAGSEFGFDFNPTVDRIRIVSDTAQNLRVHPDTGVVVSIDGSLAYAAGDSNFGTSPLVAGSAYTNSVAGATSTTLYGIDTNLDVLVSQVPPNAGTLNTIGSLGRDVTAVAGFDITPSGTAYAVLNTSLNASSGNSQLYRINLTTGYATWVGNVPNANPASRLRGLAAVPERADVDIVVLTTDNRLATFAASAPWAAPAIAQVTGLQPGEDLLGIDFRPATGQLYGLGAMSQLYAIDVTSGVATAVGGPLVPALNGSDFGFDFNPTVDRIRIVSNADQNLRAHPDTGLVVAIDGTLAYATGDVNFGMNPVVTASAYTNSLPGATSTLLYGIDTGLDVLVSQVPPNSGTLNTIGSLGRDVIGVSGFDIASDGQAFAVLTDATTTRLYRVDLLTGSLAELGNLGLAAGASMRGLAVRTVAGLQAFGTASPGCGGPAWLGAAGTPFAGSSLFELVAHHGPTNALGFFVLSLNRLTTPVSYGGLNAWIDGTAVVWMTALTTNGAGTSRAGFPLDGAWFGLALHFQWIGVDACGPIGLTASAGLTVTVQ
ncbi:MAG: DUF4394 domain-containing protein [Planctomycetota bacterium]